MTFLLTVSPKEAVELLNGNLADLIRSWKVPLGTAYIAVKKEKPYVSEWHREEPPRFFIPTKEILWIDKIFGGVNYLNGLVVAKCEITGCKKVSFLDWRTDEYTKPMYHHTVSNLTVLDKSMELKDFIVRKEVLNNDKTRIGWLKGTLTRLPSRWQEVEVGE
jgi:hypothetical protein